MNPDMSVSETLVHACIPCCQGIVFTWVCTCATLSISRLFPGNKILTNLFHGNLRSFKTWLTTGETGTSELRQRIIQKQAQTLPMDVIWGKKSNNRSNITLLSLLLPVWWEILKMSPTNISHEYCPYVVPLAGVRHAQVINAVLCPGSLSPNIDIVNLEWENKYKKGCRNLYISLCCQDP